MWQDTVVTCPLCGNSWHFIHTFKVKPEVGSCEKCATHYSTGTEPRNMIEWKRPKTLYHVRPVPLSEQ